jgi:AraC-like DNA-binding protein
MEARSSTWHFIIILIKNSNLHSTLLPFLFVLYVLNYIMPVMEGKEILRRIKNDISTSHMPVVMLTARTDIFPMFSGIEKSPDAYLLIPFNETGVESMLKNLTGLRRKLREHNVPGALSEITDQIEPGPDDQFVQKILSLVDANIDDDRFGIEEVCDSLGISRAQIYRKFKSFTDRTPHDYLRTYRLQKAKELLITTKLKVFEVAYRTGFKNVSHFCRIFTEEFGNSPGEFRR